MPLLQKPHRGQACDAYHPEAPSCALSGVTDTAHVSGFMTLVCKPSTYKHTALAVYDLVQPPDTVGLWGRMCKAPSRETEGCEQGYELPSALTAKHHGAKQAQASCDKVYA